MTPAYCFFIINSEKTTDDSHGVAELSASSMAMEYCYAIIRVVVL